MTAELVEIAAAIGIARETAEAVLCRHGPDVLRLMLDGVNRGLGAACMAQALEIDPLVMELLVAAHTKKQAAAPLGSWSAIMAGGTQDTLGDPVREAISLAIARCTKAA